jgi:hypothetical protein
LPGNSKRPETATKNWKGGPTRRTVLTTIASAGVAGILVEGAEAADVAGTYPVHGAAVATDLLSLFHQAVDAFNMMSSIPEPYSPLFTLLDPNRVKILDVNDDSGWFSGSGPAAVAKLYTLAGANFDPFHDINWNSVTPDTSHANKVKGVALWRDVGTTELDSIPYTFTYKNNLLVRLRARSE